MRERRWELDIIRIISCFFVIVIHVAGYGMEIKDPNTADFVLRNFVVCLTKCAVPMFFMISGILFLEKEISIKTLYKKYIARILLIWVSWSAFYALIDCVAYFKKGNISFGYFMEKLSESHYHLWFLPALLIAYIFHPILQVLVQHLDEKKAKYLGGLLLLGVIIRETGEPLIENVVWENFWSYIQLPMATVGVVYFVLGYYIYKSEFKHKKGVYLSSYFVVVSIMAIITLCCSKNAGTFTAVTYNYLGASIFFSSVFLFYYFLKSFSNYQPNEKMKKVITAFSECTLGIYLIHTLFIEQVYRRVGLVQENFNSIVAIILFSVMTFVLSFIVTYLVHKIPKLGKVFM